MTADLKADLKRYLQLHRDALLWKVDGLNERDLRLPRTPTGMNLLGIVKHMINVEIGYFGDAFGRDWPTPRDRVSEEDLETDPQADWFATAEESAADLVGIYQRVWLFSDATIDELSLDAVGRVPWWPEDRNEVTLGRIMVHVLADLTRHVGHADIVREGIDGAIGMRADASNLPEQDWPAYVVRLTGIANLF